MHTRIHTGAYLVALVFAAHLRLRVRLTLLEPLEMPHRRVRGQLGLRLRKRNNVDDRRAEKGSINMENR